MNNKNYYTIIPSSIRYDKRLKSLSKLIYGEIAALTNDKGYCWANNNYFAEIYSVSKDTISRSVKQLEKYNYIKCVYDKTKQNNEKRKIYIKKFNLVPAKNPIQYSENFSDGIDKKAEDNNKYNNLNNKDSELKKDTNKLNSTDNKKDSPSPCFEFNIFVNELIDTFNFLTGNKASKLYHLHSFKTKGRQEEIKSIFEDRRYDWKGCINLAKNKVKDKDNLSGIWLDFLSYLKIYRENTIKRHYSKEELIKREEKLKEIELIKIQKEREEKLKLLEEEKRLGFDKMTEDEIIEFTKRNLMFLKHA